MIAHRHIAWCDACGHDFGPKHSNGHTVVHWSDVSELFYALGSAGWGILSGDDGAVTVLCADCRRGGGEE